MTDPISITTLTVALSTSHIPVQNDISYNAFSFAIMGPYLFNKHEKKKWWRIFLEIQSLAEIHVLNASSCLSQNVSSPKNPHHFYKNWSREKFCQSCGLVLVQIVVLVSNFVQTPFFSIFITSLMQGSYSDRQQAFWPRQYFLRSVYLVVCIHRSSIQFPHRQQITQIRECTIFLYQDSCRSCCPLGPCFREQQTTIN